jgi:hypothetical protein
MGEFVPLEITSSVVEYVVKLVRDKLIRREESKRFWVVNQGLVEQLADGLHARNFVSLVSTKLLPVWNVQWLVILVRFDSLSQSLVGFCGNDTLN